MTDFEVCSGSQLTSRTLVITSYRHWAYKLKWLCVQAERGDHEAQQQRAFNNSMLQVVAAVIWKFHKVEKDAQSFDVTIEICDANHWNDSEDDRDLGGPEKGN